MYVNKEQQDVLRAASMYYLQDLKMEVIARHLGTSRSTVSRLIKRARQSGLVEITLRPASTRAPGLGRSITSIFGVECYVVPVPDSASDIERLEQASMTGAKLISSWFDSDMVMGLAWGTTLASVWRRFDSPWSCSTSLCLRWPSILMPASTTATSATLTATRFSNGSWAWALCSACSR